MGLQIVMRIDDDGISDAISMATKGAHAAVMAQFAGQPWWQVVATAVMLRRGLSVDWGEVARILAIEPSVPAGDGDPTVRAAMAQERRYVQAALQRYDERNTRTEGPETWTVTMTEKDGLWYAAAKPSDYVDGPHSHGKTPEEARHNLLGMLTSSCYFASVTGDPRVSQRASRAYFAVIDALGDPSEDAAPPVQP